MGTCPPPSPPPPSTETSTPPPGALLAGSALFVTLYLAASALGYALIDERTGIAPVWPATGLTLAALLRFGAARLWPALAVGVLLKTMWWHHHGFLEIAGVVGSGVLGPLLGAHLTVRYAGGPRFLKRSAHWFRFALFGAGGNALVSSTLGAAGVAFGQALYPSSSFWLGWFNWCASDVVGALLVVPPLLAWSEAGRGEKAASHGLPVARGLEALLLAVTCGVSAQFAFGGWPFLDGHTPTTYLSMPILIWAAFRFPGRGVTTANAGLAGLAIFNTLQGHGPFASTAPGMDPGPLTFLQLFLVFASIMAMGTAAVVTEGRAQSAVLEDTVAQRTGEIRASNDQLRTELAERMRAEVALRDSRAVLRQVIDVIPQAVWWKDRNSVYLGCNHTLCRHADLASPEDIVGRTDYDLPWSQEEAQGYRALDAHVMQENRPEFNEIERQTRADGSVAWLSTSKVPLQDAQGRVVGVLGTFEDITERRRIEQELLTGRDGLETRVRERTAELAQANEKLLLEIGERARAEMAARESETHLRLALEAGRMSVWRINMATDRVSWSKVSPTYTPRGWSPDTFPPSLEDFARDVHPEDRDRVLEIVRRCQDSDEPVSAQYRFLRKRDGEVRWLESRAQATFDSQGRVDEVIGLSMDITRRKEQEALLHTRAEQQRTVSLLGQSALAGLNLDALLREAAELVAGTLGVEGGAVCEHQPAHGQFILRAAHGFPLDRIGQALTSDEPGTGARHVLEGPIIVLDVETETRFRTAAFLRELGFSSAIGTAITGGEGDPQVYGTLGAYSRRRRQFTADDATFLQAVANVLAAAIERKRALEAIQLAREEAERANEAKSEFLSRMSHELRTPLNAILGFGQLLEIADLAESHQQSVEFILRAGRHLLALIDEILDIARIESGQLALNPQAIDAVKLLGEVLTLLRPMAAEHSVRLEPPPTGGLPGANGEHPASCRHVLADGQRLKQILLNLLSNAIKFNRPGGEVNVACHLAPGDGDRVRLEVRDTGRGLSETDRAKLFTPFERLDAGRDGIEGSGIGLALSKRLAESMQGAITVESEPGVGSAFTVELPRATDAPEEETRVHANAALAFLIGEARPAGSEPDVSTPGQTVLYIEDNLANIQLVERIFERRANPGEHYHLLSAMQGGLGLELARQHRPAVILLDLQLPDMSGEDVLLRLRADAATRAIPVLVLSADVTPLQVERILAAGADGYVTKPLDLKSFLTLLDTTLAEVRKKTGVV